MKRKFALLLAMCIGLSALSGCTGEEVMTSEPESNVAQEATPTPEPTATPEPIATLMPAPTPKKSLTLGITLSDLPSILGGDDSIFEFTTYNTDLFSASKSGSTYSNGIVCFTKPNEDELFSVLLFRYSESVHPTSYLREKGEKFVSYFEGYGVNIRTSEWLDEENHVNVFGITAKNSDFDDNTLSSMLCEVEDKTASTPTPDSTPTITTGEINALRAAKNYLSFTAFSYRGLISQLEYEGYSTSEATYGADNCGADWNEQAAKKAQEYIDFMNFSQQGLIDQLIYEGFTQEQAEFGTTAVGY